MELSNNIIKHSNAVNAFISIEEKTNHYSFMFKITVKVLTLMNITLLKVLVWIRLKLGSTIWAEK
jgi:hypothetical protein